MAGVDDGDGAEVGVAGAAVADASGVGGTALVGLGGAGAFVTVGAGRATPGRMFTAVGVAGSSATARAVAAVFTSRGSAGVSSAAGPGLAQPKSGSPPRTSDRASRLDSSATP